ncbi:hypothetical protein ACOJHG_003385 [Salmonella enterica subsp. enterica serovar Anatum]|nr:hypothetical protein [Salmonella enterica subsp. enterica serovar Worthington]
MIYENELWHSFLLRSQIMYNLSNFRNIISSHGALRYDAFPRLELIDIYKLYNFQDLYDILSTKNGYILTSSIVSLSSGVYGYFNAIEEANQNKFHITNSYPLVNISKIRYCHKCIFEDIHSKGVGYLRHRWLFESKCAVHNTCLYEVCFNSYFDAVEGLSGLIISGINPHGHCSLVVDIHNPFKNTVYLLPCARNYIIKWISGNKTMLVYFLCDLFKCKSHSSLSKVIESRIMHGSYISAVFRMLSEVDFCDFNSFINDFFEDVSYSSIGLSNFSVNVNFLRLRNADCKSCQLDGKYSCPHF